MSNGILVDQLEAELTGDNQPDRTEAKPEQQEAPDGDNFEMPEKLRGKSAEEIAKAYINAEKRMHEVSGQLGEYRQMTDRLLNLEEKRVSDLEAHGAEDVEFDIDPTELLSNPKGVFDQYYEKRLQSDEGYKSLQERLDRIEKQTVEEQFQARHPDTNQVVNDPQFQEWVMQNSYRSNIAQRAVQNQDYESLDYLLSDYKERFGSSSNEQPSSDNQKDKELKRAKQVATESSSSGGSSNSSKVYSRREIVNLKVTRPEEYRERAHEFTRAYAEGRVTD